MAYKQPSAIPVSEGGTGATTLTDGGIVLGSGTSAVTVTSQPTDGQLLIGSTGVDPVLGSITQPAAGLTVTGGSGSITLALADDLAAVEGLATTGMAARTASNTWATRTITAGTGISVADGDGVSGNPTISSAATVPISFPTDSGTATPSANALTVAGGTGINTAGSGATVTVNLDTPVAETNGGTGQTTYSTGDILYASASNTLSKLTAGSDGEVLTLASGVPSWAAATGGFTWNEVTGTSGTIAADNGYITNNASQVTMTLPSTCSVGDYFRVVGKGAGGWKVAQNASQLIHFGNMDTTTGTGGSLESTNDYDCVELLCISANTDFLVISAVGNITVT